jgi:RecA/RadA recombinase
VDEEYFTNRADELAKITATLREPSAKLLVYGPRRMGKTSAILRAIARHQTEGGVAFLADLSTASTLVDIANRILESAGKALGRKWKDSLQDLVQNIGFKLTLTPDPGSGIITPSFDLGLRSAPGDEQQGSLTRTLEAVETLARDKNTTIGIALDEFQEIQRFGGEAAEWQLRGIIQRHQHVSYVLAGSEAHVIERMLDQGRAFYGLVDQLRFGPMDEAHLAAWIDDRMTRAGVRAAGVGQLIIQKARPRTRDIVQVARQCFDTCRTSGQANAADVEAAFDDVVAEQESPFQSLWSRLTPPQQNVLRAVAADQEGLTTRASLQRYGLTSSGAATRTAGALVDSGSLLKAESNTGYVFDSPFFGRWVFTAALGDLGLP